MRLIPKLALAATLCTLPVATMAQEAHVHATPQDALEALMAGLGANSSDAVAGALGPGSEDLLRDDAAEDRGADWALLSSSYMEGYRFIPLGEDRVAIELGRDDWRFPIELARGDAGWSFDIEAGREEIVARLIGLNELDVIDVLHAYVEIQREFRQTDHDGDGILEFAAHIIAGEGARDGLYWPGEDGPIGNAAARASLDGFSAEGTDAVAEPFFGYYFRLLTAQGENAPGGAMDYFVNGQMLAGHALLAVPAVYGETGIFSFMVAENGIVHEADLGEDTLESALAISTYDPDTRWRAME